MTAMNPTVAPPSGGPGSAPASGTLHLLTEGSQATWHAVPRSYAVPALMQYAPAIGSFGPLAVTSCAHSYPFSHAQYEAPSSVLPFAFAQRHEQYTVSAAARSLHWAGTAAPTGVVVPGTVHGWAPGGAPPSACWP